MTSNGLLLLTILVTALTHDVYTISPQPEFPQPVSNQIKIPEVGNVINGKSKRSADLKDMASATVKVAIVCDLDFGKLFKHDRQKILDYWTVYFWDISLRFKTLPSVDISFRINSVTVIATIAGQPFIEDSRNKTTGLASLGRINQHFAKWILDKDLPKYDIAFAAISTRIEPQDSDGYLRKVCGPQRTFVVHENNVFTHVMSTTKRLAQLLGSNWDAWDPGCTQNGYIMSHGIMNGKYFFSNCSNKMIHNFIRSSKEACPVQTDDISIPVIDPNYNHVLAFSMDKQCEVMAGRNGAFVPEADADKCQESSCIFGPGLAGVKFIPIENSECLDGRRCFRGRCRQIGGLLMNVGSGLCVLGQDRFSFNDISVLGLCPFASTALDQFIVLNKTNGKMLAMPFSSPDGKENADKCIQIKDEFSNILQFNRCIPKENLPSASLLSMWEFISLSNEDFVLKQKLTQKCVRQEGNLLKLDSECDPNDASFRWKFEQVIPPPGLCKGKCHADLHLVVKSNDSSTTSSTVHLEIILNNADGAAIAPAVLVYTHVQLKLTRLPHNCVRQSPTKTSRRVKCYLAHLLKTNQSAQVAMLEFNLEKAYQEQEDLENLKEMLTVNLTALTGSVTARSENKSVMLRFGTDNNYSDGMNATNMVGEEDDDNRMSTVEWILIIGGIILGIVIGTGGVVGGYCFYNKRMDPRNFSNIWTNRIRNSGGPVPPPNPVLRNLRPQESRYHKEPTRRPLSSTGDEEENVYETVRDVNRDHNDDGYLQPLKPKVLAGGLVRFSKS